MTVSLDPPIALGSAQQLALALAGTVRLPSPVPATGDLYLLLNAPIDPDLADVGLAPPPFTLKLVQRLSDLQQVTYFLPTEHLRAIEAADPALPPSDDLDHDERPTSSLGYLRDAQPVAAATSPPDASEFLDQPARKPFPVTAFAAQIKQALDDLRNLPNGSQHLILADVAIFVAEAAPVMIQSLSHFGVTAAEASASLGTGAGCCRR